MQTSFFFVDFYYVKGRDAFLHAHFLDVFEMPHVGYRWRVDSKITRMHVRVSMCVFLMCG